MPSSVAYPINISSGQMVPIGPNSVTSIEPMLSTVITVYLHSIYFESTYAVYTPISAHASQWQFAL